MTRPKTKILVDGGDPQETRRVKELLGFVDGQTTNPFLIAKNPHIRELIASRDRASGGSIRPEVSLEFKLLTDCRKPILM
jgi:transaldolase